MDKIVHEQRPFENELFLNYSIISLSTPDAGTSRLILNDCFIDLISKKKTVSNFQRKKIFQFFERVLRKT